MSFITKLFKSAPAPAPIIAPAPTPAPTPTPILETPTIEDEKKKLRQGAKAKSTILTSPLGLAEGASSRKTLLGQ